MSSVAKQALGVDSFGSFPSYLKVILLLWKTGGCLLCSFVLVCIVCIYICSSRRVVGARVHIYIYAHRA